MLQVKPRQSLIPIAEGSIRPSEKTIAIGLAVHNMVHYHHPVFNVVEDRKEDDWMTKKSEKSHSGHGASVTGKASVFIGDQRTTKCHSKGMFIIGKKYII